MHAYIIFFVYVTVERGLYNHTSSLQGPTTLGEDVRVELKSGAFRFLEQNYTSVFVSLPMQMCYIIHCCISSQVGSDGFVSLNTSFQPPYLDIFWANTDPSRGGQVLYRETQDPLLILRSASEVITAFPDQSAFTPVSLFIATWLQVHSNNLTLLGVS